MSYNIAIDGPAGAGKSTIAKEVARQLGFIYIDTGAMYRAMAYFFLQNGIAAEDVISVHSMCDDADISIRHSGCEQQVILNGDNITSFLRTEEVGNLASAVAVDGYVRHKLVQLQRKLAYAEDVIMDGRDIGTCVLPDADLKIYLTANSKMRAKRRFLELAEKNIRCNINEIEADIIERDIRDMTRDISPLKQAEDAILIDSSDKSIDDVVSYIIELSQKTNIKPSNQ